MNTGWNQMFVEVLVWHIINLLGNEYWLELLIGELRRLNDYKPTGK